MNKISISKTVVNKIKKFKPNIQDSTLNNYIFNMQKLHEHLNLKKYNIKFLQDHESILDLLESKNYSVSTKRNYIIAILVFIQSESKFDKDILDKYSEYLNDLTNIQNEKYYDNDKNLKEQNNWITLNEIENMKQHLLADFNKSTKNTNECVYKYQKYLILSLYTLLPPIRNDYAGDTIITLNTDTTKYIDYCINTIILNESKFILCNYKTKGSYGNKIIDIPKELNDILTIWYNLREKYFKTVPKYLLIKTTDHTVFLSKNHLTKYLNSIFYPKKISTTILRKVYLSEKYPVIHTYREMKNDAYIMGHDINTAKLIYSKK